MNLSGSGDKTDRNLLFEAGFKTQILSTRIFIDQGFLCSFCSRWRRMNRFGTIFLGFSRFIFDPFKVDNFAQNISELFRKLVICLIVRRIQEALKRIELFVDGFQNFIVALSMRTWYFEFRFIVIAISFNLPNFQFEVRTTPEIEGIDGTFTGKLRMHQIIDFIPDLLSKFKLEHLAFISRIARIGNDFNV